MQVTNETPSALRPLRNLGILSMSFTEKSPEMVVTSSDCWKTISDKYSDKFILFQLCKAVIKAKGGYFELFHLWFSTYCSSICVPLQFNAFSVKNILSIEKPSQDVCPNSCLVMYSKMKMLQ